MSSRNIHYYHRERGFKRDILISGGSLRIAGWWIWSGPEGSSHSHLLWVPEVRLAFSMAVHYRSPAFYNCEAIDVPIGMVFGFFEFFSASSTPTVLFHFQIICDAKPCLRQCYSNSFKQWHTHSGLQIKREVGIGGKRETVHFSTARRCQQCTGLFGNH